MMTAFDKFCCFQLLPTCGPPPGGVPDLGGGAGDGALSGLDDVLQTVRAVGTDE